MRLTRTSGSVGGLGGRPPRSTRPTEDPTEDRRVAWNGETQLRQRVADPTVLAEVLDRRLGSRPRVALSSAKLQSTPNQDDQAMHGWVVADLIDLNPVAAGIAEGPEASEHTSIEQRVEHVKATGRTEDLKEARRGSVAGSTAAEGLEETLWLCPIEDRRRLDSSREGMLEGFSLWNQSPRRDVDSQAQVIARAHNPLMGQSGFQVPPPICW